MLPRQETETRSKQSDNFYYALIYVAFTFTYHVEWNLLTDVMRSAVQANHIEAWQSWQTSL